MVTQESYSIPDDSQGATLRAHHQHMLEVESGISPNMIVDRRWRSVDSPAELREIGFADYQCRPGLLIPEWTTGGVQRGYKLRPDNPRIGKNGKPIKYESPAGSRLQLDCPPSMTHALRDPTIPLYVTEGSKKADAAASHGLACVSISGVYGFMRRKLVLDDLDDIDLEDRAVRVAFDSDVTTNPKVADALHRLCAALSRRGANVEVTTFMDADGAKVGFDDYFVNGGAVDGLDALTRPWDGRAPLEGPELTGDLEAEVERLRARVAYLERECATLVLTAKNPHVAGTTKMLVMNVGTRVRAKASRGDVEPDGRVRLSPAEISEDYRPKPEPGQPRMKTNPDGSPYLLTRSSVKNLARAAHDAGLLDVEMIPVRKVRGNGRPYVDHDLVFTPPVSLAAFIAPTARYAPSEPTPRKDYEHQAPCRECGEVHARTVNTTRRTICGTVDDPGCGAVVRETTKTLTIPVPPADRPTITDAQRGDLDRKTRTGTKNVPINTDRPHPSFPAPTYYSVTKNVPVPDPSPSPTPPSIRPADLAARFTANGWD